MILLYITNRRPRSGRLKKAFYWGYHPYFWQHQPCFTTVPPPPPSVTSLLVRREATNPSFVFWSPVLKVVRASRPWEASQHLGEEGQLRRRHLQDLLYLRYVLHFTDGDGGTGLLLHDWMGSTLLSVDLPLSTFRTGLRNKTEWEASFPSATSSPDGREAHFFPSFIFRKNVCSFLKVDKKRHFIPIQRHGPHVLEGG